jgi:hypothetical protein
LTSGVSEAKAEHSPTDNVHAVLNLEKEPGSARLAEPADRSRGTKLANVRSAVRETSAWAA